MSNFVHTIKSKNGYQYFFLKLGIFTIILFIADFLVGNIFRAFYLKQKSGWEYRTKYAIEDTKADILIFGSSRAQQQYNPVYFEDRLKASCYNVGRDGQVILYQYPVLQAILKRYTPKAIILECDNRMFIETKDAYERLSCLLPFYEKHPEIRAALKLKNSNEQIKLLSHMYPYNSTFFKIVQGIFKKEDEDIKGYVALKGVLIEEIRKVDLGKSYKLDTNRIAFYRSFIALCSKAGVKLVITASPYFSKESGNDTSLTIAKKIAYENNIPFYDLSKGHLLLSKSNLFDDTAHVNQTGAKILSNIVIDSILFNNNLKSTELAF